MRLIALLILAFAAAFPSLGSAQEAPSRAGRLAFIEGTVALYQDPEAGWEKAFVNSPITGENSVWTDPRSRAEIRISGVVVRLDEATQLDVARVDEEEIDGYVVRGSVAIRVRHAEAQPAYFATPHAAFRLGGAGRYRIDVDADRDETVFTVFAGSGSMRSGSGEIRIEAGRAIRVAGDNTFVRDTARSDAFDGWTLARDEKWVEKNSLRYVSSYMTGYEDLDAYGQWSEEPGYGALWYPSRVASDWVPYRQGHWAQVRPWGWTWIAEEPWGYAPYHYGRWVYVRNRWGWLPGQRVERPVWAPALVAWVGGTNFSVRVGSAATPAVGWYPLAPWERYEPWYRTNTAYASRVNVVVRDGPPRGWQGDRSDGRGDSNSWRTYNRERAATVVRRDQFIDRRPVQQARITNVAPEVLRQAPVASPNNIFTREDVTRRQRQGQAQTQIRTPGSPPAVAAPAGAPASQPQPSGNPQAPSRRTEAGTNFRPNFQRERRNAQAPAPAPAASNSAPNPAQAPAPAGNNPLTRAPRPESAAPQQQQQQQQQQRQQRDQQEQQRAAREAQQAQERAAREAQQAQQRQQQEQQQQQQRAQEQQRQQQERQGAEQRRAQERTAREAQQQQQQQQQKEQQQKEQQQKEQQQRAAREAQQAQQRQQQEQQQAQQRQQKEQQQAQQRQQQEQAKQQEQARQQQERQGAEQRRAQERAAREAQQQQQRAQPPSPPAAQPSPPPAAQPLPQRAPPQPEKEKGKDKDKEKDKDNKGGGDDKENPGKGRGH